MPYFNIINLVNKLPMITLPFRYFHYSFLILSLLFISCKNDSKTSANDILHEMNDSKKSTITKSDFVGTYSVEFDGEMINDIRNSLKKDKLASTLAIMAISQLKIDLRADSEKLYVSGNFGAFDLGTTKDGVRYEIEDNLLRVQSDSTSLNGAHLYPKEYGYNLLVVNRNTEKIKIDSLLLQLHRIEADK